MLYFYYGENTYLVKELVKSYEADFCKVQGGDLNLSQLDGKTLNLQQLIGVILAVPFLGSRRLVVIKNFLLENEDKELPKKIIDHLVKLPDFTDLLFLEMGEPDKRTSLFKFLEKNATVKKCEPLEGIKLHAAITKRCSREGMVMGAHVASHLVDRTGADLWRLNNEVRKLIDFARSKQSLSIEREMVDLLVEPEFSAKIFTLTDAILNQNVRQAVSLLEKFLSAGEDPLMILNMIVYQLRQLLIVSDSSKRGLRGKEIANRGLLRPFVVNKLMPLVRKFSLEELSLAYGRLGFIDSQIKTGKVDAKLAMTLFVVEFSRIS
ncbi:MAG TPA: DNA polymerase III subunit delta [bacterium]|nr:DNA polymerase III subunit delta [bacterium]